MYQVRTISSLPWRERTEVRGTVAEASAEPFSSFVVPVAIGIVILSEAKNLGTHRPPNLPGFLSMTLVDDLCSFT